MGLAPRTLPVLDAEVPLANADPRGQWTRAGANYVWSRFLPAGGITLELFERISATVVRVPVVDRVVHIIPTGRPYRLDHVYGFWRATEADTMYLRTPAPGGNAYMLITGTSYSTYTKDRIFWICAKCGLELRSATIPKKSGLDGLRKKTASAVRAFNSDPASRTCSDCGTVHPYAYGMDVTTDNAVEAAARLEW
jgi:RNase P subunit RPR2